MSLTTFLNHFFFFFCHTTACAIFVSDQGSNPYPLHWKYEVLTAGLPGKFLQSLFWHFPQWIYSIPTLYHNRIVSYSVKNNNNNNTSSYDLWLFSAFFRFRGCRIVYVISTGFWIRFGFKTNVCYLLTIYLGQSSRLWWTFFLLVSGKDIATHSVAPRNLEIIFDFSFPFPFHIPQVCSFSRIYTTNISQICLLLT